MYDGIGFTADIRARPRWETRDLVREEPAAGKWRLILCRNLAIYLDAAAKNRLHAALVEALAHDGFLMLGRSERITDARRFGLERIEAHVYRSVR